MEEERNTLSENNTYREPDNSIPDIQTTVSKLNFGSTAKKLDCTESNQSAPFESVHTDARRTSFLPQVSSKHYGFSNKDFHRVQTDGYRYTPEKQNVTAHNLESFDSNRPENSVRVSSSISLSTSSSINSRRKEFAATSYHHSAGHGSKNQRLAADVNLVISAEQESEEQAVHEAQYLLPETSGFARSSLVATPKLKRGRGRPRKEGLVPLSLKTSSRGLSPAKGHPFGTRGHRVSLGRSLSRGGRGGRRGRPPILHAAHALRTSLSSGCEELSNPRLSPAELATKSDNLSPFRMAEYLKQQAVTSGVTDSGVKASLSVSMSPVPGANSSSSSNPSSDVSMTPDSQSSGHLCALCNCGERSLLGQGETWRFEPSDGFDVFQLPEPKTLREAEEVDTVGKSKGPPPTTWRRSRGPLKTGRERSRSPRQSGEKDSTGCHVSDELSLVGFHDDTEISQLFEPSGHIWAHHSCAMWSEGVTIREANQLELVDKAVYNAMSRRCTHCRKFGATVVCCIRDCGKVFHFPCASASGCFQDMKTLSLLCLDHIDQAEAIAGNAASCIQCGLVGTVKEQLFCTSCGHHYHGNCLCPPVDMKPIVRAGWQCPNCKICQTCRTAGEDSKMLVCDKCDKGYHTFCFKPVMTTIPKNGWKCKNCRVCTDCGSRTPGSGPSSRWHLNYSVCDSCYQQRNKGLCCPLCGKAYRHFHNKTMLPCMLCKKYVHIECDPSINPNKLEKLKDLPQDYICTVCRETDPDAVMELDQQLPALSYAMSEESVESFMTDDLVSKDDPMLTEAVLSGPSGGTGGMSGGGLTASSSQDSLFMGDDSSSSLDFEGSERGLISPGSRRESFEFSKKGRQKSKHSGCDRHHHHHSNQQQQQQQQQVMPLQSLSEKRQGPKIKVKIGGQVMGIASVEGSSPISHHSLSQTPISASSPAYSMQSIDGQMEEKEKEKDKKDDDDEDDGDDHPSTLILAESIDSFVMDQDICKACGSFGKDEESRMIVCTQCGQCYHPYCVSVTVTKVMLQKGWRCLDCTVCEGCGGPYDEGRLLLCDDCDISYHTYCLEPPLETVPKGNWKCKWCVMCVNCGSTSPGFACQWMCNYTQCGPCHSKMYCPVCLDSYLIDQLIIQCQQCDRWLHCECDGLTCEDEAEIAADFGYHCLFCRPRTGKDGPLPPPPPPPSPPKEERAPTPPPVLPYIAPTPEPPRHFFVDGVYLYQTGLNQIQRLQVTNPKKYRHQHQQIQRRMSQLDEPEESTSVSVTNTGEDQGTPDELGEDGVKKRKPRRVFGLGVGGFIVRQRSRQWLAKRQASYEEQDDQDKGTEQTGEKSDKPKRRRKMKKSKLEVAFPFYMQEAFFGKSILEQTKETTKGLLRTESDSDQEESSPSSKMTPAADVSSMRGSSEIDSILPGPASSALPRPHTSMSGSEQSEDIHSLDESELKDILHEFQENDDIFSIIHEELKDDGLSLDGMEAMTSKDSGPSKSNELPDNLENILASDMDKELDVEHMITEGLVHFDSKTVEDIFSGVLSDSQTNQPGDASTSTGQFNISMPPGIPGSSQGQPNPTPHPGMSPTQRTVMRGPMGPQPISGPSSLPPFGMPFNSPYGHSQQMSPNFPQGMGQALPGPPGPSGSLPPWGIMDDDAGDSNKRTILKWEQEEEMGDQATISCVLYVNMCHPDLKQKYPDWSERSKQIAKLWRKLTPDEKAPYLSKARKNRTSSRVQKAQKQVSQELQRRQEIQKQQDSEAMPPPPAPPPLPPGELYHDGSAPGMVPHATTSSYPRHSWQEDGPPHKPPNTPGTPDHTGSQGEPVFMPQGLSPGGGMNTPDPYMFDPFSPTQTRPVVRPPHRLPGLQAFGASSPRDDDTLFTAPGMSSRVHPNPDIFGHGPQTPVQDMFMGGPRRPQGPGPQHMSIAGQADASNPLGDSVKPRVPGDPYAFAPSTPQTPVSDDTFLPLGPPTPDPYHTGRRDMFPGGPSQMRPPLTPSSMGSGQGSPYPGSPVRMPEPNFRHPLSRSNSLPDPYSMQIGTPRPQMDPSMSRAISDVNPEASQMYRDGRMPVQLPEEGGENQGNMHHQQLRVILGQQTKQRMAKKQEEAERMMQGPSPGWQGPNGSENLETYQPRPQFPGPSPQGFMRSPHPGMGPQAARPPFFPGPGGMQRLSHADGYIGSAQQDNMMPDQRSQFMQMMQDRMDSSSNVAVTPSGPILSQQMGGNLPPFMSQGGESGMMRQQQPQQQQQQHTPPGGHPRAGEQIQGLSRPLSRTQHGGDDEIFTENEGLQASTSKTSASEDGAAVEPDTLLEGIGKTTKPSLSSEEDKNEDDDLLSADGTFDILKYADPDLDLDLDDKMFEHLDFMEDHGHGDQKKSDEEKSDDSKDIAKDDKDPKGSSSRATDFQAQFLEFNQRQKSEALKEKDESDKTSDEKEKEKSEVVQIAAMLQGTETMSVRLSGSESGTSDMKPSVADLGMGSGGMPRTTFNPNLTSPHMSPSQVPPQPGSSGLPSPKIMHSPRSGQPSPRTPGIQSPFNTMIGGRHSASPHSQPMTPGGPQLSPFSAGSVQIPFSPPTSTGGPQPYGQGPSSAPHSPYPTSSQPPFASMPSPGPPHMMSPSYNAGAMGLRPLQGFNQLGHPGVSRGPLYGPPPHGIRPGEGQQVRFPRAGDVGMEGLEGLGPCMPQPMTLPDGRPHPMYQQMQARGMRGPPPSPSGHPSLQNQLTHPQARHPFPGHPPRLSHPPQIRGVGPRQPGPPFPGAPPSGAPQSQMAQREQITLLDDLVEKEKEEQKRQAEQQAMMHRRDGSGPPGEQGMSVMSSGPPSVSGAPPPPISVGGMPMRMEHPGMQMTSPHDGSVGGWSGVSESVGGGPPPGQFQQGFPPRMMLSGMQQRPPTPFVGPPDIRGPGPSAIGSPQVQNIPMGPPTPVSPPSGEMGPEYERQANLYEDWMAKQAMYLESQVKLFEGQVNKLKRSKKTIQARQRLAKKNGQELNPTDTAELERISTEQSGLQKQLEAQRKLLRQHQHQMQDYKTKQQEQFGRMWTGGMAETPIPGTTMPISHPRTPGGHNSVRLSPTARQEYDAYMQNRIRQANQMQQQNRMRAPTTILGDNNPFSEAFQQREQIQRSAPTPGAAVAQTPGTPGGPPIPMLPPGPGPLPTRPPFGMGGPEPITAPAGGTLATSQPPPTSGANPVTSSSAAPGIISTPGPHMAPGPQPMTVGQSLTPGPTGQPIAAGTPGPMMSPMHPGTPTMVPRGPMEGMGAVHFFRERNMPFEGGAGTRFPRPLGQGTFPNSAAAPGQGPSPRLPPYPGSPSIYPQTSGPGPAMEQGRIPFQSGIPYQSGMPMPNPQLLDASPASQTPAVKEKKKRKKKKKSDELEDAHSQPLPPSIPSQAVLGQMSSQPSSVMTSASSVGTTPKPAELPRPQSETERRILEILNNSQKELQNPSSPSSARGGKSPRSRSPARAQPVLSSEVDKGQAGIGTSTPSTAGPPGSSSSTPVPSDSLIISQSGTMSGISDSSSVALSSCAFASDKLRQGDGKNIQPSGYLTPPSSVSETQITTGIPSSVAPPPQHMQQRMPLHPQQSGGGPMPPGFQSQQHIHQLQTLARMQQFQQQQFTGMSEGPRHRIDSQQLPVGGPRYPQMQRFPLGVGQSPHPFHGRPPQMRPGGAPYLPQGMATRMLQDSRLPGSDAHMISPHSMMQQRISLPTTPGPHLRPPISIQQSQHTNQTLPPGSPLPQQTNQAPPLSHMPPDPNVHYYQGLSSGISSQTTASTVAATVASSSHLTSTVSNISDSQPPSLATSPSASSIQTPQPASSLQPPSSSSSSQGSSTQISSTSPHLPQISHVPSSPSNIPAEVRCQSPNSSAQGSMAATSSTSITITTTSTVTSVSIPEKVVGSTISEADNDSKNEKSSTVCEDGIHCGTDDEEGMNKDNVIKKVCDDGIHCGTDDENDVSNSAKNVCKDGIHCGTDDEEDTNKGVKLKKVCDDGIHCGTDDEDDVSNNSKKLCDDGVHCGTDDEEVIKGIHSKKVCDDGIHCGTDDEEDTNKGVKLKKVCDDGIHCGTDDEEDTNKGVKLKKVCDDGIHCGTDDEEDVNKGMNSKKVCEDGIHCGTDDEEDVNKGMNSKKVCDDGIHCGTDDEEDVNKGMNSKKVCDDGIHCGTDDEEELNSKKVCEDGIHCGTDDEEDANKGMNSKKACEDGIHCGTDDEEDMNKKMNSKKVCDDGIHCGTDDEEDVNSKKVCEDGIHCGTDDEEDVNKGMNSKKVCDDGIHCGTDDEDMNKKVNSKKVCDGGIHCGTDDEGDLNKGVNSKKVCEDGIHCGTDDEEDGNTGVKLKKTCEDGIHCGTDDEEEVNKGMSSKKVCDDGIHCGTDDEEEVNKKVYSKQACDDGIHCGTDDEEEVNKKVNSKKVCDDGIHCGTDDEEEVNKKVNSKKVCDDGIHCGTDDEEDGNKEVNSKKVCDDGIHCGTDDEDDGEDKTNKPCAPTGSESDKCQNVPTTQSQSFSPSLLTQSDTTCTSVEPPTTSTSELVNVATSSICSNNEKSETDTSTDTKFDANIHSSETSQQQQLPTSSPPSVKVTITCGNNGRELSLPQTSTNNASWDQSSNFQTFSSTDICPETNKDSDQCQAQSSTVTKSSPGSEVTVTATSSAGIPMVSIDFELSSQLAAVSRSLANYKPRLGPDSSEPTADTIRPSDTLTAFSFSGSSAPPPTQQTLSVAPTSNKDESTVVRKEETSQSDNVSVSGKTTLTTSSLEKKEEGDKNEVSKLPVVQMNSKSLDDSAQSLTQYMQEKSEKSVSISSMPSSGQKVDDLCSSVSRESSHSVPQSSDPSKLASKTLSPSLPSAVSSFSFCGTPAQDTVSVTSQHVSISSSSNSTVGSVATTLLSTTSILSSASSFISNPASISAPSSSLTSSHAQHVGMLPSLPQPTPPAQVTRSWIVPPSSATTGSTSNTDTPSMATSVSSSRSSDSRPVIPPLRIRMDSQSQAQVYESSMSSSREYYRATEFTTVHMRSKAEGDLKLVLRKSSDGTAELISGPSFREKSKRTPTAGTPAAGTPAAGTPLTSTPVTADADPPSFFSRIEPDQRKNIVSTSLSGADSSSVAHPVSMSPSPLTNMGGVANIDSVYSRTTSMTYSPQNVKNMVPSPSSTALTSSSTPPIMSTTTPLMPSLPSLPLQTYSSSSSSPTTLPAPSHTPTPPTPSTPTIERTEPFATRPGSGLFKNVTYTKSPDTDVVKINVGCTKTSGEGTKKVIRSYTTDVHALERLQSTIDAVASGESSFTQESDNDPPSRPESQDSRSASTPMSMIDSAMTAVSPMVSSSAADMTGFQGSMYYSNAAGQLGMPQPSQHHQLQQPHPQMGRGVGLPQQRTMQPQQPMQQQSSSCMQQSQQGFAQHQSFHTSRLTRPPLDLLAQVSQSALSSAGTAIPALTHSTTQEQRMPYMTERPPSVSSEHSPLHSPHQSYPGIMGSRPMGSSSGMPPKPTPGQNSQAYMTSSGPPQQQFMPGVRFPPRIHHDMSAAPSYGMPAHPMSPTGTGMHRHRPPNFGMSGDLGRMQRPPRGMSHPQQHRPLPPEMMNPDHGMHPRMPHQFMSPSHPGMSDMSATSHGMQHPMAQSPHGVPQSPHVMQASPHGMQRPPMMNPHHPIMQGGPPSSYPQASISGSGGPLASLANFHPPGHPGISTSMGSPVPGPHHQRAPVFPQMMPGDNRMAAQLRMMVSSADGPHMGPHYRHMMMRGMTPPGSQPSSQMSSPQMSPHMSPQMSPVMQTQSLRQLDSMPDDKSFITSLPPSSSMCLPGMAGDSGMIMGGKPKSQRPYGMLQGDPCGFMPLHQQHHMQATSDSGSVVSTPGLTSPMSDTAISISSHVKLEPSEDSASADGSVSRDGLDLDLKAHQNELLKHLLGTGHGSRQLPTPDSEDSLPSLTPEQQRQLELIDSMPLCKETEISTPEWESKTPEEKEKILEMRRQEYEQKRQEYEVSRKNKRKAVGGSNLPVEKKKRKSKVAAEITVAEIPRKRSKKSKLKENQLKELEAQAETFLQQLHNMPSIPLQEPIIATSMSILPIKGALSLTGISVLRGRFCSAYLDNIEDMYGSLLFPQPPPGLRPTVPTVETLAQRQLATDTKLKIVQGMDPLLMLKNKEGGIIPARPGLRTSPRLILPPQPRIEIKSEQMRDKKDERQTPDTVVSSSSPEFGFNDQDLEYPGLRPIDPAVSNIISPEDSISPVVPLIQPLPIKPVFSFPAFSGIDQHVSDTNVKQELGLVKQDSSDHELGPLGPVGGSEHPARDLTVNLPNLTSGLAQPFLDPALDQQVSVTLTLSTGAAQDIGAVISAIADLLKIAVPPTYEITRTPSPEMFRMSLTHKEEAVNIHTLMSTRPRFCQHCDVFVLCSGIAKFKREFPILVEQDPDCGDEEMIFCSMNCSMQFSAALEARQRQAQLRIKELDSARLASQTPPPCPPIKMETPSSAAHTPSSATISANVDEIIAAVAADMSLSPAEPDTPGDMSASPGTPSTTPTSPLPTAASALKAAKRSRRSSSQVSDSAYLKPLVKKWRGLRWRRGNQELLDDLTKIPPIQAYELDKLWKSLGIIHRPKPSVEDKRKCVFCQNVGDGDCDGPSRLLNMDVNKWVHLNCALWSYDVYETLNGALMNVELAFQNSLSRECTACRKMGATLPCFKPRCGNSYHLPCARLKGCMFYQDKTLLCPTHYPKMSLGTELTSLVVLRRVYINRDEDRQVASMIHQEEGHCSLRIGSLILHSIGQLLPHQILCGKFNTKEHIYPVGFRTSRFYWSYYSLYRRCRYMCSIHDNDGEPEFRIQIIDSEHEEVTFKDNSPAAVWMHILKPLERMRRDADLVKMFPTFLAAEELFGLTEANVVKVLESLPGTDLLTNYNFKFGRSPLIEMPPAINPTGCARAEPKLRTHFRRPHTLQSTNSRSLPSTVTGVSGDMNSPYLKQFVHSKSQQYRRLKTDWKTLVYLGRSRIQGLGLYAARDLEKHTMVIEYIGDLIRNEVANRREKEYESQNRGVYMFRIDNEAVIDATKAGGPARYINHSCNPNCVAEVVDIEKESKIIIITSRKIVKGEELTYDYKFDFEDDQHKIPCMCGAPNCRKWMN